MRFICIGVGMAEEKNNTQSHVHSHPNVKATGHIEELETFSKTHEKCFLSKKREKSAWILLKFSLVGCCCFSYFRSSTSKRKVGEKQQSTK